MKKCVQKASIKGVSSSCSIYDANRERGLAIEASIRYEHGAVFAKFHDGNTHPILESL
jgi:hypothetical protein